jgi:hypothetical protein
VPVNGMLSVSMTYCYVTSHPKLSDFEDNHFAF